MYSSCWTLYSEYGYLFHHSILYLCVLCACLFFSILAVGGKEYICAWCVYKTNVYRLSTQNILQGILACHCPCDLIRQCKTNNSVRRKFDKTRSETVPKHKDSL